MSENEIDEKIEPEKNYLNQLIKGWTECRWVVHQSTTVVSSVEQRRILRAFIAGLPNKEKNGALRQIYLGLQNGSITTRPTFINPSKKFYFDLIEVFGEITDYCAKVYFKNFSYVRPKYNDGKLEL
jgi:hypothetical protein